MLVNATPIFEWYMAWFVVKSGHQTYTCYNEILLCARYRDTVLERESSKSESSYFLHLNAIS